MQMKVENELKLEGKNMHHLEGVQKDYCNEVSLC